MSKTVIYLILSVGMGVGAYVPAVFGADGLSGWSIIGSFLGGIVAVFAIYKLNQ